MNIRKNIFLALTSGLLLGLPWSVSSLFFVVFIAWVPLLLLEEKVRIHHHANAYAIFNYAFVSFLLWNIIGTWWVIQAQLVGAILIIIANSLLQALIFWLASRIRTILQIPLLFPFLFIWMGYEHFHLSWDLAWPWLNLGNALATAPKLIQWYEFTGVRGGTLWIILTNFAVLKVYHAYQQKGPVSIAAPGATALIMVLVPILLSYLIFQNFEEEGETVNIALIQPNLDPYTEKFDPANYARHVESFFKTADVIVDDETQYLFGPETLIVEQIDEKNPTASIYYRDLLEFRKKYQKLNILLGVHSYQKLGNENIPPGSRFNSKENFYYEAFNTALFLPSGPVPVPQFYHKTKLVPLFERMPFVQYLDFLGKYSLELGGYTGTYSLRQERTTFVLPDASVTVLPIVCFESIFGPYCSRNMPKDASFICMITNDGWWKNTPGYRHHFNFSPVRAIENRRDFVRVANTGISALINAKGMVIAKTPWWEKTTLKGRIHLRRGQTFFARHGDFLGRISLVFGGFLLLYTGIRKLKKAPR
ncbi:MAG: apolipoprotein N-acyltransferase [Deltaproteobacteria bacterium]|jgi:apolipoprotein N-acyltransferase|nr:apolipoprotein N-acyltransferase [Deltaproteobacteria bacterium]